MVDSNKSQNSTSNSTKTISQLDNNIEEPQIGNVIEDNVGSGFYHDQSNFQNLNASQIDSMIIPLDDKSEIGLVFGEQSFNENESFELSSNMIEQNLLDFTKGENVSILANNVEDDEEISMIYILLNKSMSFIQE